MTTKPPVLTRDPSPASKQLLVALVSCGANSRPEDVINAGVNHLGQALYVMAKIDGKRRGELKAMARKAADDMMAMALANFDQTS